MLKTVFLGGTTGNDYRERITAELLSSGKVTPDQIFNPVVEHWTDEAKEKEDAMKADPSVLMLFYFAANKDGIFISVYSTSEALMGLYDSPERTIVLFDYTGMVPRAAKRMRKIYGDWKKRFPDAPIFESFEEATAAVIARIAS